MSRFARAFRRYDGRNFSRIPFAATPADCSFLFMDFEFLTLQLDADVAVLTLNRPDSLNAMMPSFADEIAKALTLVLREGQARALVLAAAGRGFCAGSDQRAPRPDRSENDRDAGLRDHLNPTFMLLREYPLPTVCAVNGPAAGAGISLALMCDIVLAAKSAFFAPAFIKLALAPDTGASWLLAHGLGTSRALAMLMLGERLSAEQAAQWGLIWRCVDDEVLQAEALATAHRLAAGPMTALRLTRSLVREAASHSLRDQMQLELEAQRTARRADDRVEVALAVKQKRPPVFKGR